MHKGFESCGGDVALTGDMVKSILTELMAFLNLAMINTPSHCLQQGRQTSQDVQRNLTGIV